MIGRYLDGEVPEPAGRSEFEDADRSLTDAYIRLSGMEVAIDVLSPSEALKATWTFVRKATLRRRGQPLVLAKEEEQRRRLEVVLYNLAESLRLIALLTFPATPRAAQELWRRLGIDGELIAPLLRSTAMGRSRGGVGDDDRRRAVPSSRRREVRGGPHMWFDSHCHLHLCENGSLDELSTRAGVTGQDGCDRHRGCIERTSAGNRARA